MENTKEAPALQSGQQLSSHLRHTGMRGGARLGRDAGHRCDAGLCGVREAPHQVADLRRPTRWVRLGRRPAGATRVPGRCRRARRAHSAERRGGAHSNWTARCKREASREPGRAWMTASAVTKGLPVSRNPSSRSTTPSTSCTCARPRRLQDTALLGTEHWRGAPDVHAVPRRRPKTEAPSFP
jgi:hypothetical protein